jgi:hypothetical protein
MDKMPTPSTLPFPPGDDRPEEQYDMRIARDGTWFYHGSPIGRIALVKLFSTVLRRDDAGDYWLITPAEHGRITVDDAPFVAVEVKAEGEGESRNLSFRTNLDEWVTAGPDHPIRVAHSPTGRAAGDPELSDAPAPYILIRDRLEARIGRAVFYELVELAEERQTPQGTELGVWSGQTFFPLGQLPETEATA